MDYTMQMNAFRSFGDTRLALALVAVSGLIFAGCQQHEISVTIKPAGGAAEAATTDAAETETASGFGHLTGTVKIEGSAPEKPLLVKQGDAGVKDASVCSAESIPDESLVVNGGNQGIANVVIFLEKRPKNIKPELAKPPTDPVFFDQKGCRFFPHLVPVQTGQPFLVLSDDSIAHNTHTFPVRNTGFNSAIAPKDRKGVPISYTKAENEPIEVKCDLHPWMRAYHFPIDHPYVALTDADGKFSIRDLPAGKHVFKVWQEKTKLLERKLEITIEADKETKKDLTYGAAKFATVKIQSSPTISYQRLLKGGEVILTRTESAR